MEERLQLAEELACPFDTASKVSDNVRRNLFLILTGPLALQQVNERLTALSGQEQSTRVNMEPSVSQVTRKKWTDFPDMSVVKLMTE